MPDPIRLQVYLAKCGIASRRKCEEIIAKGRITVNGKYVLVPGTKVEEDDVVTYDGRKISQAKEKIYIALHKPSKFLCSTTDPDDRPLAIDLITPIIKQRLFYVGRLDYLTSGLIFFTNDGEFSKKMTHPSTHIEKEYVVTTKDEIPVELMEEFKQGIYVQGEKFKMKDFEFKGSRCVHIILEEGKNREIRKVFLSRNVSVKKVHRIRIGAVDLKGIHSGHLRRLTEKEVRLLLKAADAKGDANEPLKKKSISHIKTIEKQENALKKQENLESEDDNTSSKRPSTRKAFVKNTNPRQKAVKKSSGKRSFDRQDSRDSSSRKPFGKQDYNKPSHRSEKSSQKSPQDGSRNRPSSDRSFDRSSSNRDSSSRRPSSDRSFDRSSSNRDSSSRRPSSDRSFDRSSSNRDSSSRRPSSNRNFDRSSSGRPSQDGSPRRQSSDSSAKKTYDRHKFKSNNGTRNKR